MRLRALLIGLAGLLSVGALAQDSPSDVDLSKPLPPKVAACLNPLEPQGRRFLDAWPLPEVVNVIPPLHMSAWTDEALARFLSVAYNRVPPMPQFGGLVALHSHTAPSSMPAGLEANDLDRQPRGGLVTQSGRLRAPSTEDISETTHFAAPGSLPGARKGGASQ
jgi:hypothetical protein